MSKAKKEGSAPAAPEEKKAADPTKPRKVRVKATKVGFYNNSQVRVGSVFYFLYDPATKWPSWMIEVNDDNEPIGEAASVPHVPSEKAATADSSSSPSSDDVI